MEKTTNDLNAKHFSRFGEFLVSFELSKRGWNVYSPIYDEYIDIMAHKYVCSKCHKNWEITPKLICSKCNKDFSKTNKSKIIAKKICSKCKNEWIGNKTKCNKCNSTEFINKPECDICHSEVKLIQYICSCGSKTYNSKFRTIQVKSSRLEKQNTYAIDLKPRDLILSKEHFYVWCCIDNEDKPHFLVLCVNDFIKSMGSAMNGISFFKDQDRQHFNGKTFGKWKDYLNKFDKLE